MTNYQKSEEVLKYQNRRPVDNFNCRSFFNQNGAMRPIKNLPPQFVTDKQKAGSVLKTESAFTTRAPPPQEKPLNPETVAKFKAAWPNLDPYACRDDFDAWLEKVPGRQPRQYDRAFLGFAKKWAIGKT